MRVEPAHIDQIQCGTHGRMVAIDADAGGVAEDLRRIDPHLKVRFAENGNPPFWCVYWESEDRQQTYLVLTVQAHQTNSGVWTGLDQRVVRRIEEIDPHGRAGYDYARELEKHNQQVDAERKQKRAERFGEIGELAAHAIRKDLGSRKLFVPRDLW